MTPLESTTKSLNGEQELHDSAATVPIANKQEHVSDHVVRSFLVDSPVKLPLPRSYHSLSQSEHRRSPVPVDLVDSPVKVHRPYHSLSQSEHQRSPVPVDADPTNIRRSNSRDGVVHRRRSLNYVSEYEPNMQEPLLTTASRSNSRDGVARRRRSLSVSEHQPNLQEPLQITASHGPGSQKRFSDHRKLDSSLRRRRSAANPSEPKERRRPRGDLGRATQNLENPGSRSREGRANQNLENRRSKSKLDAMKPDRPRSLSRGCRSSKAKLDHPRSTSLGPKMHQGSSSSGDRKRRSRQPQSDRRRGSGERKCTRSSGSCWETKSSRRQDGSLSKGPKSPSVRRKRRATIPSNLKKSIQTDSDKVMPTRSEHSTRSTRSNKHLRKMSLCSATTRK
jgi:hypothetical protein